MQGRFLEKGSRYIVNFESISVIIKNMPEDEVLKGDLRDNLMMILEDTDALSHKLGNASKDSSNSVDIKALRDQILDATSTLDMLSKQYQSNKSTIVNLIEDMNVEFEQAFFKLGLLEQQEDELTNIVASKTEQFNQSMTQSEEMKQAIFSIQEQLKHIVQKL
jgi:hypothetical protein